MIYFAFVVAFLGSIGAGTYLVIEGHPWFGFFVLLIGGCLGVSRDTSTGGDDDE